MVVRQPIKGLVRPIAMQGRAPCSTSRDGLVRPTVGVPVSLVATTTSEVRSAIAAMGLETVAEVSWSGGLVALDFSRSRPTATSTSPMG